MAKRFVDGSCVRVWALLLALCGSTTYGAEWILNGSGSWVADANWVNPAAYPDGPDAIADIDRLDITGNRTISLDASITVGRITIGDTNNTHAYTLQNGAGGGLTFDVSAGTASLIQTDNSKANTISATVELLDDLEVTNNDAADALTFSGAISGNYGLRKSGGGKLVMLSQGSSYSGKTVVSEGVLQLGTAWTNADSIPGGLGSTTNGSNLELNGGTVTLCYYLRRSLGIGPGQLQLTGGVSGFSHRQADTYGQITINNDPAYELVWGSDYFKPDVLVLNEQAAEPDQIVNIRNKIDLNGAPRTVACKSTKPTSANYVNANNGLMYTTGGRLTGVIGNSGATPAGLMKAGPGVLQLTAANTYDGDTRILEGTLDLPGSNALPDTTALFVSEGATVYLRDGVNDTITYLYLAGKPMAVGTWGSSASEADYISNTYFSTNGTGVLTVLASPKPEATRLIVR